MFPHDARAQALSASAMLLDEFLARQAPEFAPPAARGPALVHGHCHQKALGGMSSASEVLARFEGLEVKMLDAGCCGMAGAFGYAREHYEVSRAIGARALIPAIAGAPPEAAIVADGFSCRAQIRHFCPGRRVMHLAELLDAPPER
jgi:Fe-S oxidoreductase